MPVAKAGALKPKPAYITPPSEPPAAMPEPLHNSSTGMRRAASAAGKSRRTART